MKVEDTRNQISEDLHSSLLSEGTPFAIVRDRNLNRWKYILVEVLVTRRESLWKQTKNGRKQEYYIQKIYYNLNATALYLIRRVVRRRKQILVLFDSGNAKERRGHKPKFKEFYNLVQLGIVEIHQNRLTVKWM